MPAYSQIQSYIAVASDKELEVSLETYRRFLEGLGYQHTHITDWLSQISWDQLDSDGISTTSSWHSILVGPVECQLAGHINGWSRSVIPQPMQPYLEPQLLFYSEELEISRTILPGDKDPSSRMPIVYDPRIGPALWLIMLQLAEDFGQFGVYLTDELDEGQPWNALMGLRGNLWAFDLAFIPHQLSPYFDNVPNTHERVLLQNGIGLARKSRWERLPWQDIA